VGGCRNEGVCCSGPEVRLVEHVGRNTEWHYESIALKRRVVVTYTAGEGNTIDETAQISGDVVLGNYNNIGRNVVIGGFKGQSNARIVIGDCNYIHDNTRILMGPDGLTIGDWNVFHNSMLIMGQKRMEIGHNCWFGQNTILDSAGGLYIGNGVRVGMYSQIWTHVASGELIEGCTLYAMRSTYIEDEVWLVGSCIVGSGLRIGRRSICLIGSLLTKDIEPARVYGGSPARLLEKLNFWKEVSLDEKLEMMLGWVKQFVEQSDGNMSFAYMPDSKTIRVTQNVLGEQLVFGIGESRGAFDKTTTYFDLKHKTYTKRLTELERSFYRYIYDHKARFIPAIDC
jgi:acetyltransferase-like isoleucine patch superfamily enzyme